MKSFVESVGKQNRIKNSNCLGEIFLIKGKDSTRRAAWYYVRVPHSKKIVFQRLQGNQSLNLNDWGTILRSGYGEAPPEEARQWALDEMGFQEA